MVHLTAAPVNRIVKSFNNGDTDVLLLTGAGSTGLSAHASPSVGSDIRPRVMIKLELQAAIDKDREGFFNVLAKAALAGR